MTVGELIKILQGFNPSAPIILDDDDGNTFSIEEEDIRVWDDTDEESPIAIYI
jgi:hypothetical protein